jgi:hypothetical protein
MHYSTFALDLYWAAPDDKQLAQHLAECDRCRAYVEHLGAVDQPIALPARPKRMWWILAAAVLAIAIAVVLWPRHSAPQVATKGEPSVQLLVHRGGDTVVWDAAMAVRARDALALRVACDEMSHVSVLVPDGANWQVAFAAPCQDGVLPFTLVVDDQPGSERISIVLTKSELDTAATQRAAEFTTRSATLWTTRFTLLKDTP